MHFSVFVTIFIIVNKVKYIVVIIFFYSLNLKTLLY